MTLALWMLVAVGLALSAASDQSVDARDPVQFIDAYIKRNEKGQPWMLSAYQRRVLALAFTFDPSGRLALRLLLWSETKKSGKTFIAACLGLWWAMTHPSTEVIVVANDLDQAVGRVFATMAALCTRNGFDRAKLVKLRATDIQCSNGTTITAIASDYRGAAGSRHSLVIFDELWGFDSERLQRLYEELTPPPTEPDAWVLVVTYAGFSGESKLLEAMYRRGLAAERVDPDLECYRSGELFMFWSHTARQPWQTPAYYESQRRSLRPSTYLRLHENRWVTGTESFITTELWAACVDASHRPMLRPSGAVFVGVDAGIKSDTAAVVAVSWQDATRVQVVTHRIWRPTSADPIDLEATIEACLRELHARMNVRAILCDPYQLHRSITTLRAAGLPIEEFPQTTANTTRMGQTLFELLKGRNLRVYPDEELRQQALNTVAVESSRGWKIAKEKAARKIDAVVALSMACVAAVEGTPMVCRYCTDPDCDGVTPPMGLMDSPLVREWFERHPDPDAPGAAAPAEESDDEGRMVALLLEWQSLAVAGDPDADRVERDIRDHVASVEARDPEVGARLREVLHQIEEEEPADA